jgi:hypothetical protein
LAITSYCYLFCSKTTSKTIEKNEEKGGNLPSSSYFYPFIFALSLQAPVSNSRFCPPISSFKFQVLLRSSDGVSTKWGEVGRREVGGGRLVRGENFGAEKKIEKTLGKGRGCVFGSSPKRLEWPHFELVHWWLLVHSNP